MHESVLGRLLALARLLGLLGGKTLRWQGKDRHKFPGPAMWLQKVVVGFAAGFSGAVVFDGNKLMPRAAAAKEGRWHTIKNGGKCS